MLRVTIVECTMFVFLNDVALYEPAAKLLELKILSPTLGGEFLDGALELRPRCTSTRHSIPETLSGQRTGAENGAWRRMVADKWRDRWCEDCNADARVPGFPEFELNPANQTRVRAPN